MPKVRDGKRDLCYQPYTHKVYYFCFSIHLKAQKVAALGVLAESRARLKRATGILGEQYILIEFLSILPTRSVVGNLLFLLVHRLSSKPMTFRNALYCRHKMGKAYLG